MTDAPSLRTKSFPPVDVETWRDRVGLDLGDTSFDDALVTTTADGVRIEPLYTASDGVGDSTAVPAWPGQAPYTRGVRPVGRAQGAWTIARRYETGSLDTLVAELERDVAHGLGRAWIVLGDTTRPGLTGLDGGALTRLASAVGEGARVAFDPGTGVDALAEAIRAAVAGGADVTGWWLGCDPLAVQARADGAPEDPAPALASMVVVARSSSEMARDLRAVLVSTAPYHDAGASPADELAYALATGVAYLRVLLDGGLTLAEASAQLVFQLGVGRAQFAEIAKLRALRRSWARVIEAAGGDTSAQGLVLDTYTSQRALSRRGRWVNQLRLTAEAFAASVGGADSLTVASYDAPLGGQDPHGPRLAINLQHLLAEESHLGRVADPAGGSWYVESLTDSLAEAAWGRFQAIERDGGMAAAIASGQVEAQLAARADTWRDQAADRRRPLVGTSAFPDLDEAPLVTEPAAGDVAGGAEEPMDAPGLAPLRLAAPFEALRARSERHLVATGAQPRAVLATLGPLARHQPRASFVRRLLGAGGIDGVPVAFDDEPAPDALGAPVVVLCAADRDLEAGGATAVDRLVASGATQVWIAGAGSGLDERADVAGALTQRSNVLDVIVRVLDALEVAP